MQQGIRIDAARVGERIRALREALGLSQRDLELPGVSYAYISRIEKGSRIPSLQALVALARALGVTAEFLVNGRALPPACVYCGRPHRRRASEFETDESEGVNVGEC